MLLNPARIVIGGGIAKAGDRLFVPLRPSCAARSPHVRRARRRQRSYGAMALARA